MKRSYAFLSSFGRIAGATALFVAGASRALAQGVVLENPLKDVDTVQEFIGKGLEIILTVAVPVLALFFIYAGFLFVSAQGDTTKLNAARSTFMNTVIGAAILLGAWVIAEAIQGTVGQLVE